ncbi:MAG: glycogen synthase, partial [Defluviitaleaceae bacterium]|nr:glycogen synthase [Defluviitaleaceae bacterium]
MNVLIVSSEAVPYAKSGGLADVAGSLPLAYKQMGVDARVVIPKYRFIKPSLISDAVYIGSFPVNLNRNIQNASVYKTEGEITYYLIENDRYFGRDTFYGYFDDDIRFAFFSKASLLLLTLIDFKPDILHFNDWQTALGCLYIKEKYNEFLVGKNTKTVFTIHNMQYQGVFEPHSINKIDLNQSFNSMEKLEFYGRISFMKAGIIYADAVTTVSPAYSNEIQTPEYGYGLDGLLRHYNYKLFGILNGIDVIKYNPETDKFLNSPYSQKNIKKKKKNKTALQTQLNLPVSDVPLIGMVTRLVDQKGFDIVAPVLNELLNMDVQLVVVGTGDGYYEHIINEAAEKYPQKLSANLFFSDELAMVVYGSADMLLMPSLFEPCGLAQLIAMRYGTIPVVR